MKEKGIIFYQDKQSNNLYFLNKKKEYVVITNPLHTLENREMVEYINNNAKKYTHVYANRITQNLMNTCAKICLWVNEKTFLKKGRYVLWDFDIFPKK